MPSGTMLVAGIPVANLQGDTSGALIDGVSFATVDVVVLGNVLPITETGPDYSGLAGLQIEPLPEPSGDLPLAAATTLLLVLSHVRRRSERRSPGE